MASPTYDPDSIKALARVLAMAALDQLMNEMTNAASPDQEKCGALKDFDGANGTRPFPR
jgi:hypothetical protein